MSSTGKPSTRRPEPALGSHRQLATEIKRRRLEAGLTHGELALRASYSREYVGRAERPEDGFPSALLVKKIDDALDAGGALVALHDQARTDRLAHRLPQDAASTSGTGNNEPAVLSMALSAAHPGHARRASTAHPYDLDPASFLSQISIESPVPDRIGWGDVDHVRSTTRAVAMAENVFGGGLSCEAAIGQLRWAGKLLGTRADDDVRRALLEAVGNLSSVVAFAAFDIAAYPAADRCFYFALWCSDESGSWALRANTLAEMSRKAAYLGDLDEALSLIEFAQVRSDRLTGKARAMLCALRARLLALTDRSREARSDVARADAHFHDARTRRTHRGSPTTTWRNIKEAPGRR